MIQGPFKISEVASRVRRGVPGAYILSRDGKAAHYVGRSDVDLASRIETSAREAAGYISFWFEDVSSPMQAYYLECEWYHKYVPSDNQSHPAVPPGTSWRCPVSGCPWS